MASKNLIISDPKHKTFFTHQIAQKHKIEISANYHYVAGTCFACKAKALMSIVGKYHIHDFDITERGEFSFAHAMERIICASMKKNGYTFFGIPTLHPRYKRELKRYEKTSALRLLEDSHFILDYDYFYKALENRRIYRYEIVKLKIKDIKRRWMGENYSLDQTSAYAYLQGDKERYTNYCKENAKISKYKMSPKRFDTLKESISKSFNDKMMPVIAGENNLIQDGQHRLVLLLAQYGEDYSVKCLKLYFQ